MTGCLSHKNKFNRITHLHLYTDIFYICTTYHIIIF